MPNCTSQSLFTAQAQDEPTAVYMPDAEQTEIAEATAQAEPTAIAPPFEQETPVTPYPTFAAPTALPLPPYQPIEDLPYCDESYDEISGNQGFPTEEQMDDPAVCRARILEDSGPDAPLVHPWVLEGKFSHRVKDGEDVESSATNANPYKSWATHFLECIGGCLLGPNFTKVRAVLSAKPPILLSGNYGWGAYNTANRLHYGSNTPFSCTRDGEVTSSDKNGSIGVMYGSHRGGVANDGWMHVFWEKFMPNDCSQNITAIRINPNAAIHFQIYSETSFGLIRWVGRAWLNSAWTIFFNEVALENAEWVDAGLEIGAANQDKQRVRVPMNFAHKMGIIYGGTDYTWFNDVMPSAINGPSRSRRK